MGQDLRISKAIPFPAWKKGFHFAGSCRLKQFRHVVFLFLRVSNCVSLRIYYVYVYMYVGKVWHMYIYKINVVKFGCACRARVEELTQCNKFGFTCDTSLLRCVKSVDVRVSSLDPCPALPRVRACHAAFELMLGFKLKLFVQTQNCFANLCCVNCSTKVEVFRLFWHTVCTVFNFKDV